MITTHTFGLGWYTYLKNNQRRHLQVSWIHTYVHSHIGTMDTCYKQLSRATLNSTEYFSKLFIMFLQHVSLRIDPGKGKAAMGTKRKKKTMNSKSGIFQLKKPQLIWEVAERISCFQFYLSEIFHPSFCICLASHITVTHQSPQEPGF